MKLKTALLSAAALTAAGCFAYVAASNIGTAQENSAAGKDREEIEAIIHDYLLSNPDVVIEAIEKYQALDAMRREAEALAAADQHLPVLMSGEDGYATGAPLDEAKVVVIELFDYNCGFCRVATDYVYGLIEEEDDIRVVFRELPILRESSDVAARLALAARDQGKYQALHYALMQNEGALDEDQINRIARKAGVDLAEAGQNIEANDYDALLSRTREIAIDLAVDGTPAFLVATPDGSYSRLLTGWQQEKLTEAIEEARQSAS